MAQDTVRAIKPSQLLIPSKSLMPRSLELLWGEECPGKCTAHGGVTVLQAADAQGYSLDPQEQHAVQEPVGGRSLEGVCRHTHMHAHSELTILFLLSLLFFDNFKYLPSSQNLRHYLQFRGGLMNILECVNEFLLPSPPPAPSNNNNNKNQHHHQQNPQTNLTSWNREAWQLSSQLTPLGCDDRSNPFLGSVLRESRSDICHSLKSKSRRNSPCDLAEASGAFLKRIGQANSN